jgi:hypothetical protein
MLLGERTRTTANDGESRRTELKSEIGERRRNHRFVLFDPKAAHEHKCRR